jgi:acetyltransferase-like isoleucine patch superfamily enzyme
MKLKHLILFILGKLCKCCIKLRYGNNVQIEGNGAFIGYIVCKGKSVKIHVEKGFVVFSKFVFKGDHVTIKFDNYVKIIKCSFIFEANNCSLYVKGSRNIKNTKFELLDDYCSISTGEDTGFNGNRILVAGANNYIKIGEGCIFAENAEVWASDTHSILDLNTNQRLNPDKPIIIGDSVWVGNRAIILKGSEIGDNSIIGANSIVTQKFSKNLLLAGIPAREIKKDVYWDIKRV